MPVLRSHFLVAATAVLLALRCTPASGFVIQLDYSLDDAASHFFANTPAAKNAVNAAAADISAAITTALSAINTDTFIGTNVSTDATFDWDLSITNPVSGNPLSFGTFNLPANTVKVYVGMRSLTGNTLGIGGPAGASFGLFGSGFANQWVGAVNAAQASSNATMRRGDGPLIGAISGSSSLGGTNANYNVTFGSIYGSLSLDLDTDNNGAVDNAALLASFWQYDHTAPVVAGKVDMYSVALHEILHSIGIGSSDAWDALANGSNWSGSNAIALAGSGTGLLQPDENHISEGRMSTRIIDGAAQEAVMDPTLNIGTRKTLTNLDLAFLRDIGWDTVPEPSGFALLAGSILPLLGRRRRR